MACIPVVVVPADATPLRTDEALALALALALGAARCVTKPFEVAQFLEPIDTLRAATDPRAGAQTWPDGPVAGPKS